MSLPPHLARLDALETESVVDDHLALDELGTGELVALMNERDQHIAGAVREALPAITLAVEATAERMQRGGRLVYVGAGTSGRLGVLDASEIPPTFGTNPELVLGVIAGGYDALVSAVESVEDSEAAGAADMDAHEIGALDTVVGIASSGRTPYVLGAVRRASARGALTVGISCNVDTPLSSVTHHPIEVPVGPEVVTGSTRLGAGTATKMVLNMFSTISMIRLGKTYRTLMVDVRATNAKLRRRTVRIVMLATGVDADVAARTLEAADWHAKLAIAMLATGRDADDARTALAEAGGVLRAVIDDRPTKEEA
ncbi:N-acetylmuramic acid 6-phosphate etherase [Mumia sp. DW29H23]|uniref:N-acetylmuramic acid 6-phosphate etherase n=1 Tax=Mumia sp. DW29H23 TaxID=3421241 RepID=UPI003D694D55